MIRALKVFLVVPVIVAAMLLFAACGEDTGTDYVLDTLEIGNRKVSFSDSYGVALALAGGQVPQGGELYEIQEAIEETVKSSVLNINSDEISFRTDFIDIIPSIMRDEGIRITNDLIRNIPSMHMAVIFQYEAERNDIFLLNSYGDRIDMAGIWITVMENDSVHINLQAGIGMNNIVRIILKEKK